MQKSYLVVTVIRPDKRGIVANVTEAVIQAPPELSLLELREELGDLGDKLGVDIEVNLKME